MKNRTKVYLTLVSIKTSLNRPFQFFVVIFSLESSDLACMCKHAVFYQHAILNASGVEPCGEQRSN